MLDHVHHRVPVTALAFYGDDVIFSGEGNLLRAYDVNTQDVLASVRAFDAQAIHGIITQSGEPRTVLVWGGDSITSIRCDGNLVLEPGSVRKVNDWILDAALSPDGGEHLALLNAHNALSIVKTADLHTNDLSTRDAILPIVPGSNCILYSAHVRWLSDSQCLVASGTAFGDVIVWSATLSEEDGLLRAEVQTHYTFSAHEGSVFGVQLSGELGTNTLDGRRRVLASCSDDRTVRVWDVSNLQTNSPTLTQLQRDTGFGAIEEGTPEEHAPPCLAKAMGHVSRIWQVQFIDGLSEVGPQVQRGMRVMSFGEDASNITWSLEASESIADEQLLYELHQMNVESAHSGKHIWSVAFASDGRFATGGADGALAIRNGSIPRVGPTEIGHELAGLDGARDNLKAYGFVGAGELIATTDQGRVCMINTRVSGHISTEELSAPLPGLRGYSVVDTRVPGVAFIAGSDGQVYQYLHKSGRFSELVKTGRKTANLFACVAEQDDESHDVSLLVTSVGAAIANLLHVKMSAHSEDQTGPSVDSQWQLSLPSGFVVTSFARAWLAGQVCIFLGARNGSIAAYRFSDSEHTRDDYILPSACIAYAHAKEAVTSLLWTPSGSSAQNGGFLHSTGRDGTHTVHRIELLDTEWKLSLVHQLALPLGPNVEGLAFRQDEHLWIWGFRRKQFVVYDSTAQREVMSVDCGGAHRSWAFSPGNEGGTFVWTQASKVYQQTQAALPYRLMQAGGHGREIKAVAVSPTHAQLIATGAEDTNIKLSTVKEKGGFRCLQTLRKHNTGIQHLQWSQDGAYLFSSGGFQEFFVWKITSELPGGMIGVVCESAHPDSGASDLRIMGFEATQRGRPEVLQISMAYSDSTLKVWGYEIKTWTLLATGDYLTACLTQALHTDKTNEMLLTTATDGHVAVWTLANAGRRLDWTTRHLVHQNAILAVATCELHDGSRLLVTGGDDNAIGITRLTDDESFQTLLMPRAHAAAVTGLAVISQDRSRILLASASIDQRLKLWRVDVDTEQPGVEGVGIKRLADVSTAVADVSSLEPYRLEDGTYGVLLCGVGMDMWKLGCNS